MLDILIRIVLFLLGVAIVGGTLLSAVRTFILPRSANEAMTHLLLLRARCCYSQLSHGTGSSWHPKA